MPALKRSREDVSAAEGLLLPTLYGYWRSSASWRVRIACEFKKIDYLYHPINLLKGEECSEAYMKINPMGQLPSWVQPAAEGTSASSSSSSDLVINQSMAILEYLDEAYPDSPQLVPRGATKEAIVARAAVRDLALLVVSGIHPLQNNAVLGKVEKLVGGGMETKSKWANDVIAEGFEALEVAVREKKKVVPGKFCYGDTFTLVDACLIPQLYNATRFGVVVTAEKFPTLHAVIEAYKGLDFLAAAEPDAMPDATL